MPERCSIAAPRNKSIWRDPQCHAAAGNGPALQHKMSSIGNALMSDDLAPANKPAHSQHTTTHMFQPRRRSPLSAPVDTDSCPRAVSSPLSEALEFAMAWNHKQSQWVSLVYRYVFPPDPFLPAKSQRSQRAEDARAGPHPSSSFRFPTAPDTALITATSQVAILHSMPTDLASSEFEAREACQKLLELIDDQNLALVASIKTDAPKDPAGAPSTAPPTKPTIPTSTLRSLHSEWSSLPSSPPPPIFHDLNYRPIPELRLSPPTSVSAKKLAATMRYPIANPSESPLTKRMRSSASSSSLI